ncbi:MAG: glycogen synthase [Anaerolineae bacterium]|nr:glycogen synthase [Anaerolineae bacterium]
MYDYGPLNVLIAAAEAVPFVKAGGLADVAGSLPAALRALGHDARLVLPHYSMIDDEAWGVRRLFNFVMRRAGDWALVRVSCCDVDGVPAYLIGGCPWFCGDERLYFGCEEDAPRYLFFCQAVIELGRHVSMTGQGRPWVPDVIHTNDWHMGLIPFLLHRLRGSDRIGQVATLHTIHNIAYQGDCAGEWLRRLAIPPREHSLLRWLDKTDNLMAIGMAYADAVNTVSPRYALELEQPYFGCGLDPLVRARAAAGEMFGVLNGINMAKRDPAADPALAANYSVETLNRRVENKRALQQEAGLAVRDDVLLVGMVSRLVEQKGLDLALPALWQLLGEADVQFVLLGTGEAHYMDGLRCLEEAFPGRVRAFLEFHALPASQIYAGCDAFLMPSRFEPCGIGQMVAMRYGALPVVRATGGLADTVVNYDDGSATQGTGFVFDAYTPDALLGTLRWVLHVYHRRPLVWQRMQLRAMRIDFSWGASASEYVRRYRQIAAARQRQGQLYATG